MIKVYQPLPDSMYRVILVNDPAPYLADGWYLSIKDHAAFVAECNKIPVATHLFGAPPAKAKRKTRKQTEAE